MALRPLEILGINGLLDFLSRQRSTTFGWIASPDPPDWVGEDRTTKAVVAIEHTRVEPRDLAAEDRWKKFQDAVSERAKGVVSGVFFVGQARLDQRFPTTEKIPLDNVAQRIVDAVAGHEWSLSRVESWEVSPTGAPHPWYWARVMSMGILDASGIWGLPPLSRRPRQEVIEHFRETVEKKATDLHTKAPYADERLLLIDVTAVHAAAIGSFVEHLIDVMEIRRIEQLPVPTEVYFRGKDAAGNIEVTRIWPS